MILYLDTSALVKLYVREAGTEETRTKLDAASMVATSRVAYPEARAALARRQREAAITRAALAPSGSTSPLGPTVRPGP